MYNNLCACRIAEQFATVSAVRFADIIITVAAEFNTEFDLESLKEFVDKHHDELGAAEKGAEKAIETVVANIDWMSKFYLQVLNWMESQ